MTWVRVATENIHRNNNLGSVGEQSSSTAIIANSPSYDDSASHSAVEVAMLKVYQIVINTVAGVERWLLLVKGFLLEYRSPFHQPTNEWQLSLFSSALSLSYLRYLPYGPPMGLFIQLRDHYGRGLILI